MTDKNQLLEKFAKEFAEYSDPFNSQFLRDNEVTADDCMGMSAQIGALLMAYSYAPQWIKTLMLATGAMVQVRPMKRDDVESMWLTGINEHLQKRLRARDLSKSL